MTDEELKGALPDIPSALEIITTLRAQLAEAQAEVDFMKTCGVIEMMVRNPNINSYVVEHEARAERAEAALATAFGDGLRTAISVIASIGYGKNKDVDAGHEEALRAVEKYLTDWTSRSQPHDRTALDRYREKVLREAAVACDWGDIYGDNAVRTILALIDKPHLYGEAE